VNNKKDESVNCLVWLKMLNYGEGAVRWTHGEARVHQQPEGNGIGVIGIWRRKVPSRMHGENCNLVGTG
jgi:hypothetical protein